MAYEDEAASPLHRRSNSTSSDGSKKATSPPAENSQSLPHAAENSQSPESGRQRLVFTDPVALRYLEEDPSTRVIDRQRVLTGFEVYIVEQWACSRVHPTFVINSDTGDPFHTVMVGVLSVPTDERTWSQRLKVYFNAMSQFHARKRETPLGILMVTNLSSFPSSLTVIPVPDGDLSRHRKDFIVNEDLKRLGCAGRAGINLSPPSPATEAKFYQLYRTSERVPFYSAAMELIRLCQMALTVFGKLPSEYVDGLLCDITERAINDWWTDIGTDLYNIEPSDGILGPTTVSALLGTLMGARNRLQAFGAPVSKDAFDAGSLKRGISSFQKSQKLDRTRRLDRQTLDKLHRVTAKAASGDGWAVPRAVKSTVAEFGGKGGEMVMGIVGGREKAGISEVETLDIDRFVQLVFGERTKWLWLGKPLKGGGGSFREDDGEDDLVFMSDDRGGYVWTSRKRDTTATYTPGRRSLETEQSSKQADAQDTTEEKELPSKTMPKKSVTDKVSDARSGLGRIRDAVGIPTLRSHHHHHKQSKESIDLGVGQPQDASEWTAWKDVSSVQTSENQFANLQDTTTKPSNGQTSTESSNIEPPQTEKAGDVSSEQRLSGFQGKSHSQSQQSETRALVKAASPEESLSDALPKTATLVKRLLRRPRSCSYLRLDGAMPARRDEYWPRHLSFSAVEDAVLARGEISALREPVSTADMSAAEAVLDEDLAASDARIVGEAISDLAENTASWVEREIAGVGELEKRGEAQLNDLNAIYQDKFEEYNMLRVDSADTIAREGGNLIERAKKVELLGAKLDYELRSMESRIEEVEEGLGNYERNIVQLERRVQNLVQADEQKSSSSWLRWGLQLFQQS